MLSYFAAYGTSAVVYISLRDWGGQSILTNPTLTAGDVTRSLDGAAFANLGTLPAVTPANGGSVAVTLTAAELTAKCLVVKFVDQTSPKEWEDFIFRVETYGIPASSFHRYLGADTLVALSNPVTAYLGAGTHNATVAAVASATVQGFSGPAQSVMATVVWDDTTTIFSPGAKGSYVNYLFATLPTSAVNATAIWGAATRSLTQIVTAFTLGLATSAQIASAVWATSASSYLDPDFMGGRQNYLDTHITSRAPSSLTPTSIWSAATRTLTEPVTATVSITSPVSAQLIAGTHTGAIIPTVGTVSGNISGRVLGQGNATISGVGVHALSHQGSTLIPDVILQGELLSGNHFSESLWPYDFSSNLSGNTILILSGSGIGQSRVLYGFNSDNYPDITFDLNKPWTISPQPGDRFAILATDAPRTNDLGNVISTVDIGSITSNSFAAGAINDTVFSATPTIGGIGSNAQVAIRKSVLGWAEYTIISRSATAVVIDPGIAASGSLSRATLASGLDLWVGSTISLISNYGASYLATRNIASCEVSGTGNYRFILKFDRPITNIHPIGNGDTVIIGHTQSPLLTLSAEVSSVAYVGALSGYTTSTAPTSAQVASAVWTHAQRTLTQPVTASVAVPTATENASAVWTYASRTLTALVTAVVPTQVTSAENAAAIWAAASRTLTALVTAMVPSQVTATENASAIWNYSTRTLTALVTAIVPTQVTSAENATAVWGAASRTLTALVTAIVPTQVTSAQNANAVWTFNTRTLTESVTATLATSTSAQIASAVWAFPTRTLTEAVTALTSVTGVVSALLVTGVHPGVTIPNVSTVASANLNLSQTIPVSNAANTVGDALNAARAEGFGKWVLSGTTLTIYAPDGTTPVRVFTLDSATNPTSRT